MAKETTTIKIKYKNIGSFDFQNLIEKLRRTPADASREGNAAANNLRHITNGLKKIMDEMRKDYQSKLIDVFSVKDDKGKPVIEDHGFKIQEGKMDEFKKLELEFGETEKEIEWKALTSSDLKHIQISPMELDLLGDAYSEVMVGPGLPDNVTSLR